MTIVWCMFHEIRSATERIFVILNYLLLFYPPSNPKIQNFEKMKKTFGYIIILQMFTINGNHIMNGSWNMERGRETFLSLQSIFCFFCSNDPKDQNLKEKWKKRLEISSFYTCAPKIMITWCTIPKRWCATDGRKKWQIEFGAPRNKK